MRDDQERRAAVLNLNRLLAQEQGIVASSSLEREVADGLAIGCPRLGIGEVRIGNEVSGAGLGHASALDTLLALDACRQIQARVRTVFRVFGVNENAVPDDMNRVERRRRKIHRVRGKADSSE